MDTNRLRQFRLVVETGSLRKAAELLRISHSGLSKSLKVLEADLGVKLLLPHGRGIIVTDAGLQIYTRSEPVLREVERLLGGAPHPTDRATPLRLGSFEVFTSYFIGELIRRYLKEAPIEVHELTPGKLEEALLLGRVDVGITYEPLPRRGITYAEITKIPMDIYALQGKFRNAEFADIPFVIPANPLEGAPSGVRGLDGWPSRAMKRKIQYAVDLMTTGLEMVRTGNCAIFIPRFVAHLYNDSVAPKFRLERLPLPRGMRPVSREVYMVLRESTEETAEIRKVARAVREIPRFSDP